MIRAGRLRHRVRVEQTVSVDNGVGGKTRSWQTVAKRWASIEPISGREFREASQTNSTVTHRVVLRAGGLSITPKNRIRLGARAFGIEAITDRDERGEMLELQCTEDTDG